MRRRLVHGSVAAIVGVMAMNSSALAVVQRAILSADAAPSGATVTMRVETTFRWGGTAPGVLILVPRDAHSEAGDAAQCTDIPGAVAVGQMTWRAADVVFAGTSYPGFVGRVHFAVPSLSVGPYYLAEDLGAVGSRCHIYAEFTLTAGGVPDSAVPTSSMSPAVPGFAVLLLAVAVAAWQMVASRRRSPGIEAGELMTTSDRQDG